MIAELRGEARLIAGTRRFAILAGDRWFERDGDTLTERPGVGAAIAAHRERLGELAELRTHPRISAGFRTHPRISAGFRTHPRISAGFRTHPRISAGFRTHPRISAGFRNYYLLAERPAGARPLELTVP
ncbi:MAG: hypothetical protein M3680_28850 [Myxococcota bacterium]|nr:hypothetical protein [Myxococcota bacterium]